MEFVNEKYARLFERIERSENLIWLMYDFVDMSCHMSRVLAFMYCYMSESSDVKNVYMNIAS